MRRRVVIVPLLLLAGALLVRRRWRTRLATTPLPTPPAAAPVALLESGARFVSVPWTLVETDPADPQLKICCAADEHMELDRVDAQETPTQVFVTALMCWRPAAAGRSASARQLEAVVSLSRPLGARELVHTPVDVEAPLGPIDTRPSGPSLYP
jgi:hypothetical protein